MHLVPIFVLCTYFLISFLSFSALFYAWKPETKEKNPKKQLKEIEFCCLGFCSLLISDSLTWLMHLSSVVNSGNKRRKLFHPGREGSFRCLCCWAQRRKGEFLFIKSNHRGPACCKAHRKDTRLKNYNCKPCLPANEYVYMYYFEVILVQENLC